jgi:hypothetical protein
LSYGAKSRWIRNSQVRKDLAVQSDLGFLESFDKSVICEAVQPGPCADTGDPESPEVSLSDPAVPIGIAECPLDGFFGLFQRSASAAHIAFGGFENLLSSGPACGRASCSRHYWLLEYRTGRLSVKTYANAVIVTRPIPMILRVWQQPPDLCCVLCVDKGIVSQVSLALGGFARKDMAVIRLFPFNFPALEDCESLGRSPAGFHLRHCAISLFRDLRTTPNADSDNQTFLYTAIDPKTQFFFCENTVADETERKHQIPPRCATPFLHVCL